MASEDPNYNFDCPQCEERLTVSRDKIGDQVRCVHCGEQVRASSPMSTAEKQLVGLIEEDEFEHPGSLKIDGISDDADDGSSWHIRCHICDSVLHVSRQQVGTKVKCNDCYSMLDVLPKEGVAALETDATDTVELEVVQQEALDPSSTSDSKTADDFDELTLAPVLDLAPEIADAQKQSFIDDLEEVDDAADLLPEILDDDEPIKLLDPVAESIPENSTFDLHAPDSADSDHDDDSDEMIELLDAPPEELNQADEVSDVPAPPAKPTELPRMPRKKGKRPNAISVEDESDADDAPPVRVHAKRKSGNGKTAEPKRVSNSKGFLFDEVALNDTLDKALGLLKTGRVWVWALAAIIVMATGSSIWHWISPHRIDVDNTTAVSRMISWGTGSVFGLGVFFVGYIILLFVGGVIFRETAQGETKVKSVAVTDAADFTSTMLLFGFSMAIAALPCMFFGYMWISLPVQFLLAGCFLFAAWENQGAFAIVSGSIAGSFAQHSSSWKKWFAGACLAAGGGVVGGLLMEVNMPIISVFTSIAGAILITFATLLYAAISGWHCGNVVEKMKQADGKSSV